MSSRNQIGILVLTFGLCCPSFGQSVPWKTFSDPKSGVTFRYPSVWNRSDGNDPPGVSALLSKDGDRLTTLLTWQISSETDHVPTVSQSMFAFAILAAKNQHACRNRALDVDSLADSHTRVIHGVTFAHSNTQSAGLGHSTQNNVYTTFRNGLCYGFEIILDNSHSEDAESDKAGGDIDPILILKTVHISDARSAGHKQ
jgi:hypothetical protein